MGIVPPTYGLRSGGLSREDVKASGLWTPAISAVQVNGETTAAGTVTITTASWFGNGSRRAFEVFYSWAPPRTKAVDVEALSFILSFPPDLTIKDFYGTVDYHFNIWRSSDSDSNAYYGESGGGILQLAANTDVVPYTRGRVDTYFKNWATTRYSKQGVVRGTFIL